MVTNDGYLLRLKNMRHISELRINFLSTGVLDTAGYPLRFAQRMWKRVKDSLVITKGKKCCS